MRTFRLFFASLLVGLLLIACSSQPTPEAPEPTETTEAMAEGSLRTITDGEGNELTFAAPPERLVCTYSRYMELLAALELEPVGVTTWEESFIKDPVYFQQPTARLWPTAGPVRY